ncbi:MAG: HPF/RaiA family ribosome-associated protein [Syntrophobacteraceae bacterium]|nr:HPF/RaiA family ribosome-associated protein [Desulfobacteraceae bacterium]
MKLPLQISARNVDLSAQAEDLIREKAEKLDRFYDKIIGCRIKVDVPHRSQRSGVLFDVRIDITVPGGELMVRREPGDDLHVAIVNSFDVAQRRLKEYAEKQRGDVKIHEMKPVARVSKLFPDEGYGFLTTPEGVEVFFHENAVLDGKFEALVVGTPVNFVERQGDKGPQASSVTIVSIA